jgi:predicted phosphodiesterase
VENNSIHSHELIAEIKSIAAELGKTPTRAEWRRITKQGEGKLERCFGQYTILLQAAGLKPERKTLHEHKVDFSYKRTQIESIVVHELDLKELFRKAGNPPSLKVLVMPDVHVKHRDRKAFSCFLKIAQFFSPHVFICLGDFLDVEDLSHWPSDSMEPRRFIPEVIEGRMVLEEIQKHTPGVIERVFIEGNHEDWIRQAMVAKLPEMFHGLEELGLLPDLKALLDLDAFGYRLIPLNNFLKIGLAHFTHGIYLGNNHARKHLQELKASIYYGHVHDDQSDRSKSILGTLEAASLGCLCRLDAKFLRGRINNWVHACGLFEFFPDGKYSVTIPKIRDGRTSLMGRVFEGEATETR